LVQYRVQWRALTLAMMDLPILIFIREIPLQVEYTR